MSSLDLAALEVEAAAKRAALQISAREIHRRLSREYLIDRAIDRVAGDAASAAGEVVGQVKENGGKAALFGAGLLLAFGAGRGTSVSQTADHDVPLEAATVARNEKATTSLFSRWETIVAWAGAIGAAGIAFTVSNLVPVSQAERDLLGDLPAELKSLGTGFLDEHLQGAKQLLAGSFGVASFAAGALGLMAAFAKFTHSNRKVTKRR